MKMSAGNKIISLALLVLLAACASIGNPDGGPYDEAPPVLLKSSPGIGATNVKEGRIILDFDENIKLVNAFEKVIVSPPQVEMPEIKYSGKRVTVELKDSLKPNTTYSIDFNDAIADNNEGNPYENFAYVFSTGNEVDTFAVSGTVLNAEDLEPIKGIVVGIHSNLNDSAFTRLPFERVSRTDSRGRFTIKGIAPGSYRVYALADANNNNLFDQKSERLAFLTDVVTPYAVPAVRPDTVWRDSITVDSVRFVNYTRFMPDDIILRAFTEEMRVQYLVKTQRDDHRKFTLYFASPNEEMPVIEGMGFDFADKYIVEASEKRDTLTYWLKDSAFYRADTLDFRVTYKVPDSLGQMVDRSDTIYLAAKKRWETVKKRELERFKEEEKAFLKLAKRSADYDENNPPVYVPKNVPLKVAFNGSSSSDVDGRFIFTFDEPLSAMDTAAIRVSHLVDTLWVPVECHIEPLPGSARELRLYAEWRPQEKYLVEADSTAFKGLYGAQSGKFRKELSFRSLDDYAVLYLDIKGVGNDAVVELLSAQGNVTKRTRTDNGHCAFFFIKPATYYLRLFIDENNNGKWDTGEYENGLQPEKVFYYNRPLELRALFEYTQDDWDITLPLNEQKPLDITKQKPDKERKKMNRNATRKFK